MIEFKDEASKKTFYRNARMVLWSGIVAAALSLWFNILKIDAWPTLVGLLIFTALWIASYHVLNKLRR